MSGQSGELSVDVEGGRLWAEVAGTGSGVVLLHAGIADARMWDPQWDALAARHRVVRYDLRGFGRADVVATRFSNRADVLAVMRAAGIDRAVLVGSSRGGGIAIDTALEFPQHVSGLVWVCGSVSGPMDIEEPPEELVVGAEEEALTEAKDWAGLADLMVRVWVDGLGQPLGRGPEDVRELVRTMCLETSVQEKSYGDPVPLDPPASGRLHELRAPMLLITGEYDVPTTALVADVLAASVPSRRIDVDGVAHLPNLERPAWFTETLLAFLDEVDATAPRA